MVFVSTTFSFEGYRITKYLGVVRGITVRADDFAGNSRRAEEHHRRPNRGLYGDVRTGPAAGLRPDVAACPGGWSKCPRWRPV